MHPCDRFCFQFRSLTLRRLSRLFGLKKRNQINAFFFGATLRCLFRRRQTSFKSFSSLRHLFKLSSPSEIVTRSPQPYIRLLSFFSLNPFAVLSVTDPVFALRGKRASASSLGKPSRWDQRKGKTSRRNGCQPVVVSFFFFFPFFFSFFHPDHRLSLRPCCALARFLSHVRDATG